MVKVIVGVLCVNLVVFVMEVVFGLISVFTSNKVLAKKCNKASKFLATKREVVTSILESLLAFIIDFASSNNKNKKE